MSNSNLNSPVKRNKTQKKRKAVQELTELPELSWAQKEQNYKVHIQNIALKHFPGLNISPPTYSSFPINSQIDMKQGVEYYISQITQNVPFPPMNDHSNLLQNMHSLADLQQKKVFQNQQQAKAKKQRQQKQQQQNSMTIETPPKKYLQEQEQEEMFSSQQATPLRKSLTFKMNTSTSLIKQDSLDDSLDNISPKSPQSETMSREDYSDELQRTIYENKKGCDSFDTIETQKLDQISPIKKQHSQVSSISTNVTTFTNLDEIKEDKNINVESLFDDQIHFNTFDRKPKKSCFDIDMDKLLDLPDSCDFPEDLEAC